MSTRSTPNLKNAKSSSQTSTAKFLTPTNSTPVKPVRSTLSLSKTVSSLPRAGFAKQKSACDRRERYNLNGNDSLNTAFTSTTPLSRTTKDGLTASSSSLSGAKSKFAKTSLFDDVKRFQSPAAKSLFGSTALKLQENGNRTPECFSKVSFDPNTPQSNKKNIEQQRNSQTDQTNSIKAKSKENCEVSNLMVAVRVRPMTAKECTTSANVIFVDENEVTVLAGTNADSLAGLSYSFRYDSVFTSYNSDDTNYANQEKVFNGTALPLIDKTFEGYNACLFAYGQTGSGKSYSMMGSGTDSVDDTKPKSEAGIIPRFCYELYHRIEGMRDKYSAQVEVSYFEIYNEKIHDLLVVTPTHIPNTASTNQTSRPALRIREHAVWGPYVEDLNTHAVDSNRALKDWLDIGNSHRATAATGMNDKSSRSHSIFSITLTLSEIGGELLTKRSRISLVDLAGSERVSQTCAVGERLKEGININQSLLALGKVIAALADSKKGVSSFVPYRDSVLTRLLKENLGGNSKTIMLATISPASLHMDETLSTLRYACQARSIVNRVKVNQDRNDHEINSLRTEVDCLRAQVQYYKRQEIQAVEAPPRKIIIETIEAKSDNTEEMEKLRQQLHEREEELIRAQKSWQDRLKEAESNRRNEKRLLQQNGLALQLSVAQKQPCLINLANDPMLSGTLLYILPPGVVRIGRLKPSTHAQSDIILDGPLVGLNHCEIDNKRGRLFIRPSSDESETYVNGELIYEERQIYHGDRIVIGGSHYFRLSNPECTQRAKTNVVDFQTAHQEILMEQEKRLRLELEVEKQAEFRKIEMERAKHELSYNGKLAKLKFEKELIDAEKEAMACNQTNESFFEYRPFESNLGEKIRRIMEHPSEEGLHEIQLKVKEATQRCKNLGLNYDFIQTQVVDEFGLFKAVVKIIDRKNNRSAEWPTARLSVWLDLLRNSSDVNAENIFQSIDIDWLEMLNDTALNDTLNSSKISLNLSAIKDALFTNTARSLFKSVQQKFESPRNQLKNEPSRGFDGLPSSLIDKFNNLTEGISTSTPTEDSFIVDVQQRLRNVRRDLTEIKNVCKNATDQNRNLQSQTMANEVLTVLREIEPLTAKIRTLLKSSESGTTPVKSTKTVRFILD